jgi:acetyl-CoA C-acetyltransferase
MGRLSRSVSIIGVGYTPLGNVLETPEIKDFTERELFAMASIEAMENAGVKAKDIDAYVVGWSGPNYFSKTFCCAPHLSEWIGMRDKPTLLHDEGCATSNIGLHQAVMSVASGAFDCVLSGAATVILSKPAEMLYPPHLRRATDFFGEFMIEAESGNEQAYENPGGNSSAAIDAQVVSYCKRYGVGIEQIDAALHSYIQVQRKHALTNPKATFITESYEAEAERFGLSTVGEYLDSPIYNPRIATVGRMKSAGIWLDGGSAIIVCATELASRYTNQTPIEVAGIASAGVLEKIWPVLPLPANTKNYQTAYEMAGITDPAREIGYFSVHDCPATLIFASSEASGYLPEGEAWKVLFEGRTAFDKDKPISTSGGRTQAGHPVAAATGVEITEAVNQMRKANGPRQMPTPPKVSVISAAGLGISDSVTVLKAL